MRVPADVAVILTQTDPPKCEVNRIERINNA